MFVQFLITISWFIVFSAIMFCIYNQFKFSYALMLIGSILQIILVVLVMISMGGENVYLANCFIAFTLLLIIAFDFHKNRKLISIAVALIIVFANLVILLVYPTFHDVDRLIAPNFAIEITGIVLLVAFNSRITISTFRLSIWIILYLLFSLLLTVGITYQSNPDIDASSGALYSYMTELWGVSAFIILFTSYTDKNDNINTMLDDAYSLRDFLWHLFILILFVSLMLFIAATQGELNNFIQFVNFGSAFSPFLFVLGLIILIIIFIQLTKYIFRDLRREVSLLIFSVLGIIVWIAFREYNYGYEADIVLNIATESFGIALVLVGLHYRKEKFLLLLLIFSPIFLNLFSLDKENIFSNLGLDISINLITETLGALIIVYIVDYLFSDITSSSKTVSDSQET